MLPPMKEMRKIARMLQKKFPEEMKALYKEQKKVNPNLDQEVNEWMDEVEDLEKDNG